MAIFKPTKSKSAIGVKLTVIARHMRTTFDHRVERIGLTGAKWRIIAVVSRCPGTTQRSIATMLDVTEVTVGRLIDRLCESGYMERRQDPEDRRAYRVYLTKAARQLLKQLRHVASVCEKEALTGFSEDEIKKLDGYLARIAHNVTQARGADAKPTRAPASKR